jgi:hypothetical protein
MRLLSMGCCALAGLAEINTFDAFLKANGVLLWE